jgi:SAM-dependent methyltransferase
MQTPSACRLCGSPLTKTFIDLGVSPLANAYLSVDRLRCMEPFYPLHVYVCDGCLLVQLEEFESPAGLFSDYAYFSSYSSTWLQHARQYTDDMISRFALDSNSRVVEIASNDGYLLQYFHAKGIPVLGVEPAVNVAQVAIQKGIQTLTIFFHAETARQLAREGYSADLIAGNNVLAHVPDLHGFVEGLKILLKPGGVVTMEFPHLLEMVRSNQFDTIYHEHFSYLSLLAIERLFAEHRLAIFDADELPTHGGSLRIYAKHEDDTSKPSRAGLNRVRVREVSAGLDRIETYQSFGREATSVKIQLVEFLAQSWKQGRTVAGYGAPAKGNTLLNYCGIGPDLLPYTVDRSPHKQGRFLPGTRIPIMTPEKIFESRPDYLLILPWNLREEISEQMAAVREWGCRFVIPIPSLEMF